MQSSALGGLDASFAICMQLIALHGGNLIVSSLCEPQFLAPSLKDGMVVSCTRDEAK